MHESTFFPTLQVYLFNPCSRIPPPSAPICGTNLRTNIGSIVIVYSNGASMAVRRSTGYWKSMETPFLKAGYFRLAVGPPQDGDGTRTCQADESWSGTAPTSCCTVCSQILNAQMQSQMSTWLSEEGISATRWELCYSSLRGDSTGAASAFHSMCDSHPRTISIARQGGFIVGGYIQRTWNEKQNDIGDSAPNWLFRMAPDMTKYPHLTSYWSYCDNGYWPTWGGGHCLTMGTGGALGHNAYCNANSGCPGVPEDFCGGDYNWGGTQLEVFYAV